MKNLFLLLVLPLILVGGVIGNAIYINEVSDRLLEQLDALPAPDSPTVTEPLLELCAVWEKHGEYVGLTTSSLLTDRVSEQTAALLAAARARFARAGKNGNEQEGHPRGDRAPRRRP